MSYFYNTNSVEPRNARDSDSDMAYLTADSRRTSDNDRYGSRTSNDGRQSPFSTRTRYMDYPTDASTSASEQMPTTSTGQGGRAQNQIPLLVMDERNVFRPVASRESTPSAGVSTENDTECQEIDAMSSPRLRAALHELTTKPIDKIHHYSQLGEYVKELYLDKGMADVIIRINDESFPTHRIALASQSEYFSNLFLREVPNTRQKLPLEIRIKGIAPDAFRAFLEYIYTGELNVNPELVSDFLFMSSKLKCHGILETWQDLLENMTPDQALILIDKIAPDTQLYEQAFNVLRQNFTQLHTLKRFYRLSTQTMCKLLTDDELAVQSELEVFEEAMKWLKNVKDKDRDTDIRILRRIRYSLMSPDDLFHCCNQSPVFKTDPVCKELILRANWLHTTEKLGVQDGMTIEGSKPRKTVVRERSKTPRPKAETPSTDSQDNESSPKFSPAGTPTQSSPSRPNDFPTQPKVDQLESARTDDSYIVDDNIIGDHLSGQAPHRSKKRSSRRYSPEQDEFLSGDILTVGGSHRRNRDHRVGRHAHRYSSRRNKWMQFAPLPEHRQNHAVAIFGGKLYLTGGCEGDKGRRVSSQACNRVFVFETEENIWAEITPMLCKRRCHSLCPLFGKLYAIGGQDEWGRVLNTVERYNPHDNTWTFVSPMKYARLGAGTAVYKGFLFVVGGYGEEGALKRGLPILKVVECFDPRIHKWTVKHNMRIPRCYCNLVCCNNNLYVFGGAAEIHSMLQSIGSVDLYDSVSDSWDHVTNLKTARHNSGSAVIGNKIYIIGGVCSREHNQVLTSIECYNAATGFWETGVEPLPHPAKSVGCAVLPVFST